MQKFFPLKYKTSFWGFNVIFNDTLYYKYALILPRRRGDVQFKSFPFTIYSKTLKQWLEAYLYNIIGRCAIGRVEKITTELVMQWKSPLNYWHTRFSSLIVFTITKLWFANTDEKNDGYSLNNYNEPWWGTLNIQN